VLSNHSIDGFHRTQGESCSTTLVALPAAVCPLVVCNTCKRKTDIFKLHLGNCITLFIDKGLQNGEDTLIYYLH
jgi:hypothetical protein